MFDFLKKKSKGDLPDTGDSLSQEDRVFVDNPTPNPNDGRNNTRAWDEDVDTQLAEMSRLDGTMSHAVFLTVRASQNPSYLTIVKPDGTSHPKESSIIQKLTSFLLKTYLLSEDRNAPSFDSLQDQLLRLVCVRGSAGLLVQLDDSFLPHKFAPIDTVKVKWKATKPMEFTPFLLLDEIANGFAKTMQLGKATEYPLNIPNYCTARLDGDVNNPYSSSMLTPALKVIFDLTRFLETIHLVYSRIGWPRVSVKVLEAELRKLVPQKMKDPKEIEAWMKERKEKLGVMFTNMKPDQALVTSDWVSVEIMGTKDAGNTTMDTKPLMSHYKEEIALGCKTYSAVLGAADKVDPLQAFLQGRSMAGVAKTVEEILSKALSFCLRMMGINALCLFKYQPFELRPQSELEAFRAIKITNDLKLLSSGIMKPEQFARKNANVDLEKGSVLSEVYNNLDLFKNLIGVIDPVDPEGTAKSDTPLSPGTKDKTTNRSNPNVTTDKGKLPKTPSGEKNVKGENKGKKGKGGS